MSKTQCIILTLLLGAVQVTVGQNSYPATGLVAVDAIKVNGASEVKYLLLRSNDSQSNFTIQAPAVHTSPFQISLGLNSVQGGIMIGRQDWMSKVIIPWKVGIWTNDPEEALQVGASNQRNINIRVGEFATIGLMQAHGETVIGNNSKVVGSTIRPIKAQGGASAIAMNYARGIRFFLTKNDNGSINIDDNVNEKFRISVENGVFADEVTVKPNVTWPDYVFNDNYKLPSLHDVGEFVRRHKHLPGIPSVSEIEENGIKVSDMIANLLKKTEELTLYAIEQQKLIDQILLENKSLKEKVEELDERGAIQEK